MKLATLQLDLLVFLRWGERKNFSTWKTTYKLSHRHLQSCKQTAKIISHNAVTVTHMARKWLWGHRDPIIGSRVRRKVGAPVCLLSKLTACLAFFLVAANCSHAVDDGCKHVDLQETCHRVLRWRFVGWLVWHLKWLQFFLMCSFPIIRVPAR